MDAKLTASPRREFQQSGVRIGAHRALVKSDQFDESSRFAMLQYVAELSVSTSTNPNLATVNGMKMAGAHEFLQVFKTLAEQPLPTPVEIKDNLNHRA